MIIRPYEEKDFENCRKICKETGPVLKNENDLLALWSMYIDYYIIHEPSTCFVAADENDEAVGYVICAPDNHRHEKIYRELYLKKLRKLSFSRYITRVFELRLNRKIAKKFSAHLHIDILPKAQRMGLGHKLVDALTKKLKEDKVNGVFLIVGDNNIKGVSFYKKYGFTVYKKMPGSTVFAIDLTK